MEVKIKLNRKLNFLSSITTRIYKYHFLLNLANSEYSFLLNIAKIVF